MQTRSMPPKAKEMTDTERIMSRMEGMEKGLKDLSKEQAERMERGFKE